MHVEEITKEISTISIKRYDVDDSERFRLRDSSCNFVPYGAYGCWDCGEQDYRVYWDDFDSVYWLEIINQDVTSRT